MKFLGFEADVLWNQVRAVFSNLCIWFLRQVLRRPAPSLWSRAEAKSLAAAAERDRCLCVEVPGPGGVDQLLIRDDCWAVCGYNVMSEFGGQRLRAPLKDALRADLVVVENRAFSVNYADLCIRWGLYESALRYVGWPIVPGFDIAGVVEQTGDGSDLAVGDRVFGCTFFGGYASRIVVPRRQLMRMPEDMSFDSAAALPAVAATALHAASAAGLWPNEPLGANRDVLVHSAAGGVGDLLCKVLRLRGMRVVGIVGSTAKVSACAADVVIDKSKDHWPSIARKHAPQGYRAVFDANGVSSMQESYRLLSQLGRLVVYGFHSNLPKCDGGLGQLSPWNWVRMGFDMLRMPRFDPMALTLESKAVVGFNLSFFADELDLCAAYLSQLQKWINAGQLSGPAVRSFALSDIRSAQSLLQSGQTVGKLVVAL